MHYLAAAAGPAPAVGVVAFAVAAKMDAERWQGWAWPLMWITIVALLLCLLLPESIAPRVNGSKRFLFGTLVPAVGARQVRGRRLDVDARREEGRQAAAVSRGAPALSSSCIGVLGLLVGARAGSLGGDAVYAAAWPCCCSPAACASGTSSLLARSAHPCSVARDRAGAVRAAAPDVVSRSRSRAVAGELSAQAVAHRRRVRRALRQRIRGGPAAVRIPAVPVQRLHREQHRRGVGVPRTRRASRSRSPRTRCSDSASRAQARSPFLQLVAVGLTFTTVLTAYLHIGVVIGLLPTTGLTLPFVSYGRSNLVLTMFMTGMLVNIGSAQGARDRQRCDGSARARRRRCARSDESGAVRRRWDRRASVSRSRDRARRSSGCDPEGAAVLRRRRAWHRARGPPGDRVPARAARPPSALPIARSGTTGRRLGGAGDRVARASARLVRREPPALVVGTGGYAAGVDARVRGGAWHPDSCSRPGTATPASRRARSAAGRARSISPFPRPRACSRRSPDGLRRHRRADRAAAGPAPRSDAARAPMGISARAARVLLVYGGSQGSLAINRVVAEWVRRRLPRRSAPHLGEPARRAYERVRALDGERVRVRDYLSPISDAYAAADLALARAGAMTHAELFAWGIPAILVPLPTAAADHQTLNARTLAAAGAAIHLPQSELTGRAWLRRCRLRSTILRRLRSSHRPRRRARGRMRPRRSRDA